jgi:hypothetical protein
MKAKTFLFFSIIAILVVISLNTARAQEGVLKFQMCNQLQGDENACVPGEYLFGTVCSDNFLSNHNWVTIDHGSIITGYLDKAGTIPSGNVYTQMVSIAGESGKNEIFTLKLHKNGKLVQMIRWRFHLTTNANGEVTASMDKLDIDCK